MESTSALANARDQRNEHIGIKERILYKFKHLFPEEEDEFGLIDISPFIDIPKEYVISRIKYTNKWISKKRGKIVIEEQVPDRIFNLLMKLTLINDGDKLKRHHIDVLFRHCYSNRSYDDKYFGAYMSGKIFADFTLFPLFLFLSCITKDKRLRVREKDLDDYIHYVDRYFDLIRRFKYCQIHRSYQDEYPMYICNYELPFNDDEIFEIIDFHYSIADKYSRKHYKKFNTDRDHIYW